MNNATIIGNLGNDPERKENANGGVTVKMSLADSYHSKKTKEYETRWWTVYCYGNTAEFAARNFVKGQNIVATGEIGTYLWFDKEEKPQIGHTLSADRVGFAGAPKSRPKEGGWTKHAEPGQRDSGEPKPATPRKESTAGDDIPF